MKKTLKLIVVSTMVALLAVSCIFDDLFPYEYEDEYTPGWPTESILKSHFIGGMPKPAAANDIEYYVMDMSSSSRIRIRFSFKQGETGASIHNWLTGDGWKMDSIGRYSKGPFNANYIENGSLAHFDVEVPKDSGIDWPSAAILTKYGLTGMPKPDGAGNIYYKEKHFHYLSSEIEIVFDSTEATRASVEDWLTSKSWLYDDDSKTYTKTDSKVFTASYIEHNDSSAGSAKISVKFDIQ